MAQNAASISTTPIRSTPTAIMVGQFGRFSPKRLSVYAAHSASFPLPSRGKWRDGVGAALLHDGRHANSQPRRPAACTSLRRWGWPPPCACFRPAEDDANQHYYFGAFFGRCSFFSWRPLVLWAWLQNRQDRIYLWLFFPLVCSILRNFLVVYGNLYPVLPLGLNSILLDVVLNPLTLPLWVMFWWHWFGLERKRWIPRAAWLITAVEMLAVLCIRFAEL